TALRRAERAGRIGLEVIIEIRGAAAVQPPNKCHAPLRAFKKREPPRLHATHEAAGVNGVDSARVNIHHRDDDFRRSPRKTAAIGGNGGQSIETRCRGRPTGCKWTLRHGFTHLDSVGKTLYLLDPSIAIARGCSDRN